MNSCQQCCIKCKCAPFAFSFRDFYYCRPCFIEQYKHKIGHALNAQPKSLLASKIDQEKRSTIAVALWDSLESLSLLKFVLYYESIVNSKYRNISYKFLLFTIRGHPPTSKYMMEIKSHLRGHSNVFEQEHDATDPFLIKTLLKVSILDHNDLVYIPSTQYDVAFFTLLLTLNGHGSLIPAFSAPSILVPSITGTTIHICRPFFYLCKEEVKFFNDIAEERAMRCLGSHGELSLDSLDISKQNHFCHEICPSPSPRSKTHSAPFESEGSINRRGLSLIIDDFIAELQRDSNNASVSILARTAQKLDSSFLTTDKRCCQCPVPDFLQQTPCDACSDIKI